MAPVGRGGKVGPRRYRIANQEDQEEAKRTGNALARD